jgi:hypothetical protein
MTDPRDKRRIFLQTVYYSGWYRIFDEYGREQGRLYGSRWAAKTRRKQLRLRAKGKRVD